MSKQQFIQELTLNFNLRQPKTDKPTSIFAVVYIKGKQYRFSTGVKVYPHQWNKKKQEAYISLQLTELDNHNNIICNETLTKFKENFTLFRHEICSNISKINNIINILKKYMYMERTKKRKAEIPPIYWLKSQIVDKATYQSAFNQFVKWLQDRKGTINEWSELTYELVKEFCEFQKNRLGASRFNTIVLVLKNAFINAHKDKNIPFENSEIIEYLKESHASTKVSDDGRIALTQEQVTYIYNMKLKNDMQELVRDMFVFECLTSVRYSDIYGADYSMHKGKKLFEIIQEKEEGSRNQIVSLELYPAVKDILDKYDWKFPKLTNKKANYHLQNIISMTPFANEKVQIKKRLANGKVEIIKKEMKEAIRTHTGRRTFITILLSNPDVRESDAIHSTGHQNTEMLKTYNKNDKTKAIENILLAQRKNIELKEETNIFTTSADGSYLNYNPLEELFDYTNLLSLCKLCANIKGEEDGSTKGIMTSPTAKKTMEKILDFTSITKVEKKSDQIDTDILTSQLKRMIPFFNVFNHYYPGTTKALFAKARILGIELEGHQD